MVISPLAVASTTVFRFRAPYFFISSSYVSFWNIRIGTLPTSLSATVCTRTSSASSIFPQNALDGENPSGTYLPVAIYSMASPEVTFLILTDTSWSFTCISSRLNFSAISFIQPSLSEPERSGAVKISTYRPESSFTVISFLSMSGSSSSSCVSSRSTCDFTGSAYVTSMLRSILSILVVADSVLIVLADLPIFLVALIPASASANTTTAITMTSIVVLLLLLFNCILLPLP